MDQQYIDFTDRMIGFVEGCPLIEELVTVMPFEPNSVHANVLSYDGLSEPVISRDVTGALCAVNQANFTLRLRRKHVDPLYDKETVGFITKLEQWVLGQSLAGNAPRFGEPDYDELMWADGGVMKSAELGARTPYLEYQIKLHVKYQIKF